jgi:spermidine synthase
MRYRAPLLFLTVLVIATAGLVYELVAGTLASYVLGDSVTQFSMTIGVYLFAMGIGAYLSRYVRRDVSTRFVEIELAAAVVGGFSAPFLFLGFAYSEVFHVLLYGTIVIIGTLVGLEIPLLMRILREELEFEELVAKVLSVDYLGALAGSILFALVLVPSLGLNRTSLVFGMLNCAVGLMTTWVLADLLQPRTRLRLRVTGTVVALLLGAGLYYAEELTHFGEEAFYADPIVLAEQSAYQRIVVTRGRGSVQLFLDGNLQFSSSDEYRYHEALVHPAMATAEQRTRVLVLGGGDGLAVREVLRWPDVGSVTLVDLDEAMTRLAREHPLLRDLNRRSLDDPRVTIIHDDAMVWLDESEPGPFDVIVADFPDPNNYSLGKLYTSRFYRLVSRAMHDGSALSVQSTSPFYARQSFWCIERTIASTGLSTAPFHVTVPSFGAWGFVLAMKRPFDTPSDLPLDDLRYLNADTLRLAFTFGEDEGPVEVETNRLNDQQLVHYYEREWSRWN